MILSVYRILIIPVVGYNGSGSQTPEGRTYANPAGLRAVSDGPAGRTRIQPVAIYHLSVKTISRSEGRTATAAAAYRAGDRIECDRTGEVHDYSRKRGVEGSTLFMPPGAPRALAQRGALWNAAEQAENRKNSVVARELEVALPSELDLVQRRALVSRLARELVERHGVAVDVALHAPGREGDQRNHHAHVLITTRSITAEGFGPKTREWDDRKSGTVDFWRERWAELQNEALAEAGIDARVDHRSLADQGIERAPTVHLGPTASAIERRGEQSRISAQAEQLQRDLAARARQAAADLVAEAHELASAEAELVQLRQERARLASAVQLQAPAPVATPVDELRQARQRLAEAEEAQRLVNEQREAMRVAEVKARQQADGQARAEGARRRARAAASASKLSKDYQALASSSRRLWGLLGPGKAARAQLGQIAAQLQQVQAQLASATRLAELGLGAMREDNVAKAIRQEQQELLKQAGIEPARVAKAAMDAPQAVAEARAQVSRLEALHGPLDKPQPQPEQRQEQAQQQRSSMRPRPPGM